MFDHESSEELVITSENGERAAPRLPVPERTVSFDEFVRAILGLEAKVPPKASKRKKRGRNDSSTVSKKRASSAA